MDCLNCVENFDKIRICIVEDDVALSDLIKDFISFTSDMTVVGIAYDGDEAVSIIKDSCPHVVILDLALPLLDGVGVMKAVNNFNLKYSPIFIVTTSNSRASVAKMAFDCNAELIMIKPYKFDGLIERIRTLYLARKQEKQFDTIQTKNSEDIQSTTTKLLDQYGFPSNRVGYRFLIDSLNLIHNNPKSIDQITKLIYPAIAKKHGTTPSNVERGIRHAIETVWSNQSPEALIELYGNSVNPNKARPTNSEFIANIARKVLIQMKTENELNIV